MKIMRCVKFIRCPIWLHSMLSNVNQPYAERHPRPDRWLSTERTCSEFQIHKIYFSSAPLENVNWKIGFLTLWWSAGFPHISRESFCARVTQQQANVRSVTKTNVSDSVSVHIAARALLLEQLPSVTSTTNWQTKVTFDKVLLDNCTVKR